MHLVKINKLDTTFLNEMKNYSMKFWLERIKTGNMNKIIFDEKNYLTAEQILMDRHPDLKPCEVESLG